jgi:hypothetical protein
MTNWCENSATFTNSNVDKINELELILIDKLSIFHSIRPIPPMQKVDEEKWQQKNWGTNWEDGDVSTWNRVNTNKITINFESGGTPPIKLYKFMIKQGWEVQAYYIEDGQGFIGKFWDGKNYCYEFEGAVRKTWKHIPLDIQEFFDIEGRCKRNEEFCEKIKNGDDMTEYFANLRKKWCLKES